MYIYFFQTSKYYPSIFYSRNIHPIFPKKNQFPFHQRFNVSLACTFPSKSPDFRKKIVNVSSEFHRSTLSTLALRVFVHGNETMHGHERPSIYQFVISRDTIRISRVARIACVLAVRLENLEQVAIRKGNYISNHCSRYSSLFFRSNVQWKYRFFFFCEHSNG